MVMLPALAQETVIYIESIPASTPANATIYVAGSFNTWAPGDASYAFSEVDGGYYLTVPALSGPHQFKFTQGSWATVEGTSSGAYMPNRTHNFVAGDTAHFSIAGWEGSSGSASTAHPDVVVWDEPVSIPQLGRERTIRVFLPPNYNENSAHYPVLYMHDGQNLFDVATAFSGEWQVDETLTELYESGFHHLIVVGVDNGGVHRIDEYTPWANPQYGGGEGDLYLDFLVETLKPLIDATYRTLPEREHTALMGSSLGGLISLYGGLRNPDVFSRLGVFSPSLWFTDDIFNYAQDFTYSQFSRAYLLGGTLESASLTTEIAQMQGILSQAGFPAENLAVEIVEGGTHSESFWADWFGPCVQWLFAEALQTGDDSKVEELVLFPNPADSIVRLPLLEGDIISVEVSSMQGVRVGIPRNGSELNVSALPPGIYQLRVQSENKTYVGKLKVMR